MDYILDYLKHYITDHLLHKSGNKVVDDFIKYIQINQINDLKNDIIEFVPYDKFKDIEFITEFKSYKVTWVDGNIQKWNKEEMNFKRSGHRKAFLKKLDNSENFTSKELSEVHITYGCNLKIKHSIFGSNYYYGITQEPITKDFMIIMDNYILDDLKHYITDHLLYRSGNKVVDDFIKYTQINLDVNMMEFVPYDQFKNIQFIAEGGFSKIYKATWIDGYIQSWNGEKLIFERNGHWIVALKNLNNSENITSKELNEVHNLHNSNNNLLLTYC